MVAVGLEIPPCGGRLAGTGPLDSVGIVHFRGCRGGDSRRHIPAAHVQTHTGVSPRAVPGRRRTRLDASVRTHPERTSQRLASMPTRDQSPNTWHILASDYPPQIGGVGDHSFAMATALAASGDVVHVWCTPAPGESVEQPGVTVHRTFGTFSTKDLGRTARALDEYQAPRRLIVQWVPHGFGWRGMNLAFCGWLWTRARRGDRVELVVHEPFMPLEGPIKHVALGLVQRAMAAILLRAASDVWVTTPAWIDRLRPYSPFRMLPLRWIPVPSTVPVVSDGARARQLRERFGEPALCLAGHFGFGG